MTDKRVIVVADFHCGHLVGLTPPQWQNRHENKKLCTVQKELFGEYQRMVDENHGPDVLIVNGDCIDGRGERSGSTELITVDRYEQCKIAAHCVKMWGAKHIIMTYGTPYHTGTQEDFEKILADMVQADKIGSQEWIDINGAIFDVKHKVGGASMPHTKGTPLSKEKLWNIIWAEHDEQPNSNVIIRSHVHNYHFDGGKDWFAVTTPALQGQGSKWGARQCSGHVDFGILKMWVTEQGKVLWEPDIAVVSSQKAKVIQL